MVRSMQVNVCVCVYLRGTKVRVVMKVACVVLFIYILDRFTFEIYFDLD